MTTTQDRRDKAKAAAVSVKELDFDAPAPPKDIYDGPRYSPYADIYKALKRNPGKWACIKNAASKAADIHKRFAGVQRTSQDGDLYLRYVTADIVGAELAADELDGLDGTDHVIAKAAILAAVRATGIKTTYMVLDMVKAGRECATRIHNGEDMTEAVKTWDAEIAAHAAGTDTTPETDPETPKTDPETDPPKVSD